MPNLNARLEKVVNRMREITDKGISPQLYVYESETISHEEIARDLGLTMRELNRWRVGRSPGQTFVFSPGATIEDIIMNYENEDAES